MPAGCDAVGPTAGLSGPTAGPQRSGDGLRQAALSKNAEAEGLAATNAVCAVTHALCRHAVTACKSVRMAKSDGKRIFFLKLFCRFEVFKIKNWECVWENQVGLLST